MKRPTIPALRTAYDGQQQRLVAWLRDLPAEAWDRPSVLTAWTIRDLAFHTTEVPGSLTRALTAGSVKVKALSIAEYTAAWRANAGQIAERDKSGAAGMSPTDVLARLDAEHAAMEAALDQVDRDVIVGARRGPIRVSDFLVTRVNELVVHSRDLSASVADAQPVGIDGSALGFAVRMLLAILGERAPGKSVEVRVPPYAAVQCIEGPRHTRGTPSNVIEVEPMLWVELACGRVNWPDAVATGQVHASGERADLSEQLPVLS
ncbi:MAG: sterol carrier family protein [Actinomycetes bacterium]